MPVLDRDGCRGLGGPGIVVFGDSFINKSTRPRQQGNRDLS